MIGHVLLGVLAAAATFCAMAAMVPERGDDDQETQLGAAAMASVFVGVLVGSLS